MIDTSPPENDRSRSAGACLIAPKPPFVTRSMIGCRATHDYYYSGQNLSKLAVRGDGGPITARSLFHVVLPLAGGSRFISG